MSTHRLFHLIAAPDWAAVSGAQTYAPASLESDGFVHLSTEAQVAGSADLFFAGVDDLLVLTIEIPRTDPRLRWELGTGPRGTEPFPHFHAPLPLAFVTATSKFRARDGTLGQES